LSRPRDNLNLQQNGAEIQVAICNVRRRIDRKRAGLSVIGPSSLGARFFACFLLIRLGKPLPTPTAAFPQPKNAGLQASPASARKASRGAFNKRNAYFLSYPVVATSSSRIRPFSGLPANLYLGATSCTNSRLVAMLNIPPHLCTHFGAILT